MSHTRYDISILKVIPKLEDQILNNKKFEYLGNLRSELLFVALYEWHVSGEIAKLKTDVNTCSLIDQKRIEKCGDRFFDYSLPQTLFVPLSDNWPYLEKEYSKLRYTSSYIDDKTHQKNPITMDENVLNGESAIWCNTIQLFMANDLDGVKRNLNIIETITLPKLSIKEELLKIDFDFYKALLEKNKSKCEEILEQLISPKIHAKRNDNPILSQYVSQPALGYAKLAWRYGLEVDVNSPLVPKAILPIEPLEHYEIPYDFLLE